MGAKDYFKKSLEAYLTAHKTENHHDIVVGYTNVGEVCLALGQFEEAKIFYEHARRISKQVHGNQYDNFFDQQIRRCKMG